MWAPWHDALVSIALIRALDDASARAVPAAEVKDVGGWLARRTRGLSTKRANSVLARDASEQDLEGKIEACERFYAEIDLPARFQLTPASQPAGLGKVLLEREYVQDAPTLVQTCALDRMLNRPGAGDLEVTITSHPTAGWWATWQTALALEPDRVRAVAALFARIGQDTAFAVVSARGEHVAVGLGVLDRDWIGIFNMATIAEQRRRGAALAALRGLARWARDRGARNAYLQVDLGNEPARQLYEPAGFCDLYRYEYVTKS